MLGCIRSQKTASYQVLTTSFEVDKGITIKEKKIIQRALELWREENLEIVDCYLIACLEKDAQNILYSYDRDFDKFKINRKAP